MSLRLEIVTTIRTFVDLEDFSTDHEVAIDAQNAPGLPPDAIYAAVIGGCKSTIASIEKQS